MCIVQEECDFDPASEEECLNCQNYFGNQVIHSFPHIWTKKVKNKVENTAVQGKDGFNLSG